MNSFYSHIKAALEKKLPGAESHKKMLPPNRVLKAGLADKNRIKNSSVLLLLFQEEKKLMTCLIKRPAHMKHHAGQIALPGGRMEEGETTIETALRETFEEIGITGDKIQILGKLSEFYVQVSCFLIHPIVGWLNERPKVKTNPAEVEKMIYFPMHNYKLPLKEIELETLSGKLKVPCIKYDGEIIWGATAMILSEFYDVLQQTPERFNY